MRRRTAPALTSHFLSSLVITQPGVKLLLRHTASNMNTQESRGLVYCVYMDLYEEIFQVILHRNKLCNNKRSAGGNTWISTINRCQSQRVWEPRKWQTGNTMLKCYGENECLAIFLCVSNQPISWAFLPGTIKMPSLDRINGNFSCNVAMLSTLVL